MPYGRRTIWHNWDNGSINNGGGFDPQNPYMPLNLLTDVGTANSTNPIVSSVSYLFESADINHLLFIQSGDQWVRGWYPIQNVSGGRATLNANVGQVVLLGGVGGIGDINYFRPNGLNKVPGCSSSPTIGGGQWSIDYSQKAASRATYTDMAISATNPKIFTSALVPATAAMQGNAINIISGTGFFIQRVIISQVSGNQVLCDRDLGSAGSTGGVGLLGGAMGNSSNLTGLLVPMAAGNKLYVKGTYTASAATFSMAASVKGDSADDALGNPAGGKISIEGFNAYPGDRAGRATLKTAVNGLAILSLNDNDHCEFVHLAFKHEAVTTRGSGVAGVTSQSNPVYFRDCLWDGCTAGVAGSTLLAVYWVYGGEVKNGTSSGGAMMVSSSGFFYGVDFHNNAGDHIRGSSGATGTIVAEECIFDTAVGDGVDDASTSSSTILILKRNTFVGNANGINIAVKASNFCTLEGHSNIFYAQTDYAIRNMDNWDETLANSRMWTNNFYGDNKNGIAYNFPSLHHGDIVFTGDPFVNRAARNFTLNDNAGSGAKIKANAFPRQNPTGSTVNYRDGGAVQHQDPAIVNAAANYRRRGGTLMKI